MPDLDRETLETLLDRLMTAKDHYDSAISAITSYIGYDTDELDLSDEDLPELDVDELLELIREVEEEG